MDFDRELYQFFHNIETQNNQTFTDFLESVPEADHVKLQNLAYRIPYPEYNQTLLSFLERKNLVIFTQIGSKPCVSSFIPAEQIKSLIGDTRFPNITEQEKFEKLMREIFIREGRIPNHEHLMGHYPLYLEKHIEVMKIVFDYDLSISSVWRYYIAYMAAATHKCEYLMKLEEKLCKLIHQDWFSDPNEIPIKLKSLGNANVKLAHRPWEFSEKDIKNLLIYWNPKELVLALTILCQFHCLSSFIFATGVCAEPDLPINLLREQAVPMVKVKPKENIVSILKNNSESQDNDEYFSDASEDLLGDEEGIWFSKIAGDYLPYIHYPMETIARAFNASDFKFSDQAYYILEKMIPEVSESIWNRIRTTFAMTYDYLGENYGVETGSLRRAIWNYVQRVYGLQYDDYRYTDINESLEINIKRYIKKTACYPETVTKQDYDDIKLKITDNEKIHVNLIVTEARFEAQLVYMLHAVQRALDLG